MLSNTLKKRTPVDLCAKSNKYWKILADSVATWSSCLASLFLCVWRWSQRFGTRGDGITGTSQIHGINSRSIWLIVGPSDLFPVNQQLAEVRFFRWSRFHFTLCSVKIMPAGV